MSEEVKEHLPTVALVSALGVLGAAFALSRVHAAAGDMSVGAFSLAIFVIPCVVMVVCSFVIMLTASAIGRQLFLVVVGICFVAGIVSIFVTSAWFSDPELAALLLANSGEGAEVIPPMNNPLVAMRDVAAFVVAPTVGCIAGAWLGSRIHPMSSRRRK